MRPSGAHPAASRKALWPKIDDRAANVLVWRAMEAEASWAEIEREWVQARRCKEAGHWIDAIAKGERALASLEALPDTQSSRRAFALVVARELAQWRETFAEENEALAAKRRASYEAALRAARGEA